MFDPNKSQVMRSPWPNLECNRKAVEAYSSHFHAKDVLNLVLWPIIALAGLGIAIYCILR